MFSRDGMLEARGAGFQRSTNQPGYQSGNGSPPPFARPAYDPTAPTSEPSNAAATSTSILGPDITIIGERLILKTKGSLLIQGQIQGDVHGATVTVDNGANVTGVITAQTIAIQGAVKGALKGSTVILHNSSKVDADIVQQTLSIAEGAQFEGSVRRARDISEVTPDLS